MDKRVKEVMATRTVQRSWPTPYCRPPSRLARNSATQPAGSPAVCDCYADLRLPGLVDAGIRKDLQLDAIAAIAI